MIRLGASLAASLTSFLVLFFIVADVRPSLPSFDFWSDSSAASSAVGPLPEGNIVIDPNRPPDACQQFVLESGLIEAGFPYHGTSGELIFLIATGAEETHFVWDTTPEHMLRLNVLLDECFELNRGVTPRIDWSTADGR